MNDQRFILTDDRTLIDLSTSTSYDLDNSVVRVVIVQLLNELSSCVEEMEELERDRAADMKFDRDW